MELLLCRFTKAQRAWIRRIAKLRKISEAELVRKSVSFTMEEQRYD